jgi:hypothetical protein
LVRVFATPPPASLGWDEVEAMLLEHAGVTP